MTVTDAEIVKAFREASEYLQTPGHWCFRMCDAEGCAVGDLMELLRKDGGTGL